jgi:multiple sugar transport system substrate-binding protein
MYNIAKSVVVLDNLIDSDIAVGDKGEIIGLTDEQRADFIESYYNEGLAYGDDQMYTMPLNKSTEVLYYDKTFFEENGLTVPNTWDELWATCEKILAIDPDCYPLGYDAEDNWFITMCEQMGTGYTSADNGGEYLFNNDENKAFVKELREYYQKGYFTTQELYGSYTSNLFVETTDTRCYMCVGSSGGASYQMSNNDTGDGTFAFEVGVAPIPAYNGNRKVISQGPSLCILKGANTTDQQVIASWLFTKFLCTNVDFQAEFSMTSGYMPVLKSVVENENYAAWLDKANGYEQLVATCVKTGIEGRETYFVSDAFNGSSTARTQVGSLLIKCLSTETDDVDTLIDQAFADALAECEY